MSCAFLRIIDYNYAFQSNVTITGSSENPDFPASNVGQEFRSKVWRSAGSFIVDTTNNKINFKETFGGPELTATVAVGTYSPATLAVAIKTAMEAASVNSRIYTVSQVGLSGKWTITGSTFLSLLFSTGTNAVISIRDVIGMASNDFTGSTTYTGPRSSIHTEEGIVFDIKTSEPLDTFALIFDPRLGIKLSEQAVVSIQGNAANSWDAPLFEQVISIDNTWSIATLVLDVPQSFRFWRVKIVDSENANQYVELGTVVLGLSHDIGRCPDNGFDVKITDKSVKTTNAYGNEYTDIYPLQMAMTFNFNILTYAVKKNLEQSFRMVGTKTPIFVMMDPDEVLFDKDDFTMYGKYTKDIDFKHIQTSYFKSAISILEVF